MQDEARYLRNHASKAYEPGRKLRDHAIKFVSAGVLQGTIQETVEERITNYLFPHAHKLERMGYEGAAVTVVEDNDAVGNGGLKISDSFSSSIVVSSSSFSNILDFNNAQPLSQFVNRLG